ncbi:glycoside hydrolase family 9 protein [Rhizobium sp. YIM 134829]|uniref:glycoside hydrolase family 9 protein n=1 Tax=Rhizobium sp. YIM 134829 TaxID=3390453 RepID=UPI00397C9675
MALGIGLLILSLLVSTRAVLAADAVEVAEVTIAAPDILAVELREPAYRRGSIVALPSPVSAAAGSWIDTPQGYGMVVGPKRDHLRLPDVPPTVRLDRKSADDAAAYGPIGSRRVIDVFRKSVPYDSGFYSAQGSSRTGASFKHYLYLQLDGRLEPGRYSISWPKAMLPATDFTYDPTTTRAIALRATQVGHTAGDVAKTAFMSLWLPGGPEDGAVDFRRYGLDRFSIVDAAGASVFTGTIRLRKGPKDLEPGNGVAEPLNEYTHVRSPRIAVRGIAQADPIRIVAPGHGFQPGDRIALEGLGGDQDAGATFATVADPTPDDFALADVKGPIAGAFDGDGTATLAYSTGRAGTFVFELDYSAFKPAQAGVYRIAVPGLGVSDPIAINPDTWFDLGALSLAGLYNHRSGIALDGRFGYQRPAAFRPGPDLVIHRSRLPLAWSQEFGGPLTSDNGAKAGWITEEPAPESYWGGYMDAGDWDRRIQHVEIASLLLDVFDGMPEPLRARQYQVPQSSALLDDPAYKAAGELPDLINEAIWPMDFFRRLQAPDGSIHGGIESASFPLLGEPSYLEHQAVFAYAPDVVSTFKYAAVAARLARVLKEIGKTELADLYGKSAIAAWQAGEAGFADPDRFYADAIAAGTELGLFDETPWEKLKETLQKNAGEYRATAAASLFRLTGEADYRTIFETAVAGGLSIYAHTADGAWDYLNSPGADAALQDRLRQQFIHEAKMVSAAQDALAYPSMKHPGAPAGWGQGTAPDYNMVQLFMRAYRLQPDDALLRTMEQTSATILGANQVGLSFTTGAGVRQILHPLQEDHRAMGVAAPRGITIYGFGPQSQAAYGWVFGPPWSPLPETGTAEAAEARRVYPPRFSIPYLDFLIEHPGVIMQQEYTVQQPIATTAALWLFLATVESQRAER